MHNGIDFGGGGGEDEIVVEFLGGGVLKISTDPISGANHTNAEGLLDAIQKAAGGEVKIESKHDGHHHSHSHHGVHLKQ